MASAVKKSTQNPAEPLPDGFVGTSEAMQGVFHLARQMAGLEAPVLLQGEPGTGKASLATVLHQWSGRSAAPLVAINCSAHSETQLEHQLFGHGVSGSSLELAQEGSLFIDEIHALPLRLQARLLGFLQEGYFDRPGELGAVRVDVRIFAATDQDLGHCVTEGKFREDLFWRLSVLPIAIPPLRRRVAEIESLVRHFLAYYSERHRKQVNQIQPAALKALEAYSWPGNIRELQNLLERAVALATSDQLTIEDLPGNVVGDSSNRQASVFRPTDEQSLVREYVYHRISKSPADANDLHKQIVEPVEKELIVQVMEACQQTQTKAANRLGINRNTLYKKLVEFGLTKPVED